MMKPAVRSAAESAVLAVLVGFACLWLLISAANAEVEASPARLTVLSLGLGISLVVHWTYMAIALQRDGRRVWLWVIGMVASVLAASAVALILMNHSDEDPPR